MTCTVHVAWDERLSGYHFGPGHPLAPVRLELTMRLAREFGLWSQPGVTVAAPVPATDADLELVHDPGYVAAVRTVSGWADELGARGLEAGPRVALLGRLQAAGTKLIGPAAHRPHRRDVPGVMHQLQVGVGGRDRGGHRHAGLAPQPELAREPHRQLQAHRCQRMARPEMIVSKPLVPGHMHGAGHPATTPLPPCRFAASPARRPS